MDRLASIISNCYSEYSYNHNYRQHSSIIPTGETVYMEVPRTSGPVEIPAFAVASFLESKVKADKTVITLEEANIISTYAAMDAKIRDAISMPYTHMFSGSSAGMIKIITGDFDNPYYYGTQGVLFDKNFHPVMMMSWIIEEAEEEDNPSIEYKIVRPLLRIDPGVIVRKSNAVERYIVNKILPTALSLIYVSKPRLPNMRCPGGNMHIKVELDECPFNIKRPSIPSVSTTNEMLLDIALENIDEIVQ